MQDIFWGAVIIAIGLVLGDSIFRGNVSLFGILFDALGTFFIIRGLVRLIRARHSAPPPPGSRP